MNRRNWLLISLAAFGCGRRPRPLEESLPAALEGDWQLEQVETLPLETAPEQIRQRNPRQAVRATYRDGERIAVTLYEMGAGASAFELIQTWRPEEHSQAFYKSRYFGVATAPGVDHAALSRFVRAFEARLPE